MLLKDNTQRIVRTVIEAIELLAYPDKQCFIAVQKKLQQNQTMIHWGIGSETLLWQQWCWNLCWKGLLIKKSFCVVYDYVVKVDLGNGHWNPKRKLGVTTHFVEIIKQQLF